MAYLRDLFVRTRGPITPPHVTSIREETMQANLRSSERIVETMNKLIDKHNAARGVEKEWTE